VVSHRVLRLCLHHAQACVHQKMHELFSNP